MTLSFSTIRVKAGAIRRMQPQQIYGHIRRRLRNKLMPRFAASYRAGLEQAAAALPSFSSTPEAVALAKMIAMFYSAEYDETVPSCFDGNFYLMKKRVDFGSVARIDWRVKADDGDRQIWRSNLAQMAYLCAALQYDSSRGIAFAAALIRGFQASARFEQSRDFVEVWHPYIASRRLLSLASLLLLAPSSELHTSDWAVVEAFTRFNAIYVLRNLEIDLGYNHLERNLAALALFGLTCETMPPKIASVLQRHFNAVVRDTICDDGVPKERSAMYQALTVQSLRIFRALKIWSPEQRTLLETRLTQVEYSLCALTLGDGYPVLFNDSWLGENPSTREIAGEFQIGFHAMPYGGYVRLAQAGWIVVMDAGAIGPDENPGHGHADFLSIEASIGRRRFIVDPGTFVYTAGAVRDHLRSWEAHNGPAIVGEKPVTFLDSFQIGSHAAAVLGPTNVDSQGIQTAQGSLAFGQVEVSRALRLDGGKLEIVDRWLGAGVRRIRFLIPREWSLERTDSNIVFRADEHIVTFCWDEDAEVQVGDSVWSRYYGIQEAAHEVLVFPKSGTGRTVLSFRVAEGGVLGGAPSQS